ncbi:LysR family transcriptional regulator [Deinococcus sp. QL22]|uniref:LysR family transcriptional regulator n=1 Tax=Deinococcus sp. QL22 TaxID=2939437 RepID=UPI0020182CEA|nr:LysR family transcriptional regulator [Deinococcus sp. QL22]UQN09801.1 LysR family transcriptional regulator [Deinococcus sp. QL22]
MHLDLNLLTALDALLEEGSVAAAAERLYLSQPAMSRTLGRIRRTTGDQILVRTGRGMTPTPYALSVQAEVHALVQQARAVLTPNRVLDLAGLERVFTLQCNEAVTTAVGPRLLAAVQALAPRVKLRFLAESRTDTAELRQGRVDLELGSTPPVLPDLRFETLGTGQLVVVCRPGHPYLQSEPTLEAFVSAPHLIISRRGRLRDPIDEALEEHGVERRVLGVVPTTTAALHFIGLSDLLVMVPGDLCASVIRTLGLHTAPMPLTLTPLALVQVWHGRYDNDPAHLWLRGQVRALIQEVMTLG